MSSSCRKKRFPPVQRETTGLKQGKKTLTNYFTFKSIPRLSSKKNWSGPSGPGLSLRILVAGERFNVTREYYFWKKLYVWKKIGISYRMLVGEFCIVNGEFSNLQCLMNTLLKSITPRKWFLWKKLQFSGCPGARVKHHGPPGTARAQFCIHNQDK